MAFQAGRPVVRLPQSALQYLGNRRTVLSSSCIERVPALYNVSQSQHFSDFVLKYRLRTPALSRAYAQRAVSRPKAHTGRTTTAARKAPTTSKTTAAKKPAPKKTTPKAVPKAKSKAKPLIKAKAKPRIKAKPKPAKKKKAKPKPKPKAKKPKKVLTEAQKKALTLKTLKVTALKPPSAGAHTAWLVFVTEKLNAVEGSIASRNLGGITKEASAEYKQLTPERVEHYNHLANQNKAAHDTAYRQWIESHTPLVIYDANHARTRLRRLGVKAGPLLQDHRQVKGRRNAYLFFHVQRTESGDFKGLKVSEATRLIGREWKGLPAGEKKAFEDMAAQDLTRYTQEMKTVLNKDVKRKKATA